MSITTADQMRLYLCIIWLQSLHRVVCIFDHHDCVACVFLHCFAYSATTSLHRIDRDHVFIASTATTSSSHRPRLHSIGHDHVFITSTMTSSHRPRLFIASTTTTSLHRIDREHVFIASTTSSSHRPRPRLHRIDHIFIASTTTTSSSHRPHLFIASTASTSSSHRPHLHRIDRDHVSSSHRPRLRLHRIDHDHVFIALTMTTSSSHRPRLHRIDRDHVFIALTTTTSSSYRPRLHRIDHVFIASTTSSSHLCINFDNRHIVCDCHLCTAPFICHIIVTWHQHAGLCLVSELSGQSVQAGPGLSCWLAEQLSIHHWLPLEYPLQKHNHNSKRFTQLQIWPTKHTTDSTTVRTHNPTVKSPSIFLPKKLPTQTSGCLRYKNKFIP